MTWADLKVLGSQPTLTLTLSPSTESIMASSKPPSPSGTQTLFFASYGFRASSFFISKERISHGVGSEGARVENV